MVQRHEVDEFRGILVIYCSDVLQNNIGNVLKLLLILPQIFKKLHISRRHRCLQTIHHIVTVVSSVAADIYHGKFIQRRIRNLLISVGHGHKTAHLLFRRIRFEDRLPPDPVRTFFGNRLLGHLIPKLHLEFGAVEAVLPVQSRNIEFSFLLRGLLRYESRGCKNKPEFVYRFQLLLQFLIGIHRKTGSGNRYLTALADRRYHIISHNLCDVIEDFHFHVFGSSHTPNLLCHTAF